MSRSTETFAVAAGQAGDLKRKMLNWTKQFSIFLFLDSNGYPDRYGRYECLLAAGAAQEMLSVPGALPDSVPDAPDRDPLQMLQGHADWLFGHIGYDHRTVLAPRQSSSHPAKHHFPSLYFFRPQIVVTLNREQDALTISCLGITPRAVFESITRCPSVISGSVPSLQFRQRTDRDQYLGTIGALRDHIAEGDCYEINFCTEGYAEAASIDPLPVFSALNAISPAPFAAYYGLNGRYMMCASPERYLYKQGDKLISQPIKGTSRRDPDPGADRISAKALRESIKEQAENVMIADLVRNDLARSCRTGSVQAEELFGIYSYPQVHQMISTIAGRMQEGIPFTAPIRYSFPMGSMTGAPKIKVMQLIEQYESVRRELFSGTVGYITPGEDFDFNVIIRSLFYNSETQYLSYQTGGAITYDSDPEREWEEMRVKAWALERIFR